MITRSLIATLKHVWTHDPAIDQAHPKYDPDQYMETGDLAHLPMKEGQRPAVFELAPLSRRQYQLVLQLHAQGRSVDAAVLACSYGLRGVAGFHNPDGTEVALAWQNDAAGDKQVTTAALDSLYYVALLVQLGRRASEASKLRPTNGQG